ncbi:hypothetical protein BDV93DRAFT_356045 [Ceratobasidium sp. AG-I]|nr:hypothetical protein BDV93DRAFT_356045 [Ceratobasidium sp. AG-I]
MDDGDDDNISANQASCSAHRSKSGILDENTLPGYCGENAPLGGLSAPRSRHSTHSPAILTRSPCPPFISGMICIFKSQVLQQV